MKAESCTVKSVEPDTKFCYLTENMSCRRGGIELVLNSRVAGVRKGEVDVFNTTSKTTEVIPFGACVWSTGVAMHPLVKTLQASSSIPKSLAAHMPIPMCCM